MTGIVELTAEAYHADAIGDHHPSLSSSIAHTLCTKSPLHAWSDHPRLNPDFKREDEQKFDVGTVAHAILLEGADIVYVCHFDSWRSNDAKDARDSARREGKVPLLAHQVDEVTAMVAAAKAQLVNVDVHPPMLADGGPEQTLLWEEDGVHFRARLDWLRDDYSVIEDLKTTARSAEPAAFARSLYGLGYDLKAAFYIRAVKAVTGVEPTFRWTVLETKAPYALSVVTPGPGVLALGEAKVEHAIALWRRCLAEDYWPGYAPVVATAELPPYEEVRWLEREAREEMAA